MATPRDGGRVRAGGSVMGNPAARPDLGATARRLADAWPVLMPGLFVVLWSTGFVAAKLGLPHIEPMTFLALRFALVAVVLGVMALLLRAAWPASWRLAGHAVVAGVLVQALYLGGVFAAIDLRLEAGTSALIVSLQPLLTAALAGPLLGERVTRVQWAGLVLGAVGVVLVVWDKLGAGLGTPASVGLCALSLVAISVGTIYQKRFCGGLDLCAGTAIQAMAAAVVLAGPAVLFETGVITWHLDLVLAMAWLVLVLSLGAISLFYLLLRRGAASAVASLFCLVPPTAAMLAWLLFDERLGSTALIGFGVTVVAVALVTVRRQ